MGQLKGVKEGRSTLRSMGQRVKAVALYGQARVVVDTRPAGLRERQ